MRLIFGWAYILLLKYWNVYLTPVLSLIYPSGIYKRSQNAHISFWIHPKLIWCTWWRGQHTHQDWGAQKMYLCQPASFLVGKVNHWDKLDFQHVQQHTLQTLPKLPLQPLCTSVFVQARQPKWSWKRRWSQQKSCKKKLWRVRGKVLV